jgi:hypothetical protein
VFAPLVSFKKLGKFVLYLKSDMHYDIF